MVKIPTMNNLLFVSKYLSGRRDIYFNVLPFFLGIEDSYQSIIQQNDKSYAKT